MKKLAPSSFCRPARRSPPRQCLPPPRRTLAPAARRAAMIARRVTRGSACGTRSAGSRQCQSPENFAISPKGTSSAIKHADFFA
jgi:hypothetical protein